MDQRDVSVGQQVSVGQRIALMISEGDATGVHLQLRVRVGTSTTIGGTDPVPYLRDRRVGLPVHTRWRGRHHDGDGDHAQPVVRLSLIAYGADVSSHGGSMILHSRDFSAASAVDLVGARPCAPGPRTVPSSRRGDLREQRPPGCRGGAGRTRQTRQDAASEVSA
ncbi:hypothetical protein AB0H51_12000 [Streptomyces griseoluteus]|uniref:hypothetical protein n=1 Tax=Streptomyces griseoluteus TaxID=29306 RepID=UPI0033CDD246